jgi:PQQ-dependent catabolism-associated CXXCW motif protein
MKRGLRSAALSAGLWIALAAAAPPEPQGYRNEAYRAPTPASLKGAKVLSSAEAHALWASGSAAFIDVFPQPPRPKNLPKNVVWRDKPRYDIPGSLWLPDTGYGELAPVTLAYFVAGLKKANRGDLSRPLAFYCRRDCWMSWNAAKRALALGYKAVDWYPDGVDGWRESGFRLEVRKPEPRPP